MTALAYNDHRKPTSAIRDLLSRIGHSISVFLASYSVAMAWASGRRAHPADLEKAGYTRELEDHVIASTRTQYADN